MIQKTELKLKLLVEVGVELIDYFSISVLDASERKLFLILFCVSIVNILLVYLYYLGIARTYKLYYIK